MKKSSDYDFIQEVFEWVFYNMPIKKDNSYVRNIYEFYQNNGGLSGKQIQVLLNEIEKIEVKPPFNPATLEAIIKKKNVKYRSKLPEITPMYNEDVESKAKLQEILEMAPQHKAAIAFMNKVNLNQELTAPEKVEIEKFLGLLRKKFGK
ncbi:MAG: hypothetical protein EOO02_03410 [Chitinophagaceae bacterium]|nr:MAG: hypothetical protein EOO02_03410 [Chitinophagaceae bacterium]